MLLTSEQRKHIKKLQQKKYRDESKQFVVEGIKGVTACLKSSAVIEWLIIEDSLRDDMSLIDLLQASDGRDLKIFWCNASVGKQITATEAWPGALAVVKKPDDDVDMGKAMLVLDTIADPGNLGTIIRTADWFGIRHILLAENSVDPYNPKVVRSSMGSLFSVSIHESSDIVEDVTKLKYKGYKTYGFSMIGKDIHQIDKSAKSLYIFGSESHGVRLELSGLCDSLYAIKGSPGSAESLNVAISVGITLHHIHSL